MLVGEVPPIHCVFCNTRYNDGFAVPNEIFCAFAMCLPHKGCLGRCSTTQVGPTEIYIE